MGPIFILIGTIKTDTEIKVWEKVTIFIFKKRGWILKYCFITKSFAIFAKFEMVDTFKVVRNA